MTYVTPNFKTKKDFKKAVEEGKPVDFYNPGLGGPVPATGTIFVEGPHYPEPHRWYAQVDLVDRKIKKIR